MVRLLSEQLRDVTFQVRDRVPGKRWIALGFGQNEGAREDGLGVIGEAGRGHAIDDPVAVDRVLDIERKPFAVGANARISGRAERFAGREGFLHHCPDEAGVVFRSARDHRHAKIDVREDAFGQVSDPVPFGQFKDQMLRPRGAGAWLSVRSRNGTPRVRLPRSCGSVRSQPARCWFSAIRLGGLVLLGVALAVLVSPGFIGLSAFVGAGLMFAGASGWCGMANLLRVMPWNRGATA